MTGQPAFIETAAMRDAPTAMHLFYERVKTHPDDVFLRQPSGDTWREYTWGEVGDQALRMAAALREMGLKEGDHVGLLSKNCAHWIVAALAIGAAGLVNVPYYASLGADDLRTVIDLSNVKALFVGKLDAWERQKAGVPDDLPCIAFPHYPGNSRVEGCRSWQQLIAECEPLAEPNMPDVDDISIIIYTSGTTGTPKGVMHNYRAGKLLGDAQRHEDVIGIYEGAAARMISYLPLNHIVEYQVVFGSALLTGGSISFVESLDTFAANLQSTQPTMFIAVPRIWTKLQQGVLAKMPQQRLDLLLKIPVVNNFIAKKLRAALGFGSTQTYISGAAPLPASTLEWFQRIDVPIQEGYGATETYGGVTINRKREIKPGSVGKPMPGVDIKIDDESGEVLIKSDWNMTGYFQDEQLTAETFKDGYYRTGDSGYYDSAGNIVLTGRIKDTFKTAKAKFIVPAPIENEFAHNPYVEQVMVTGRGLPQPLALAFLSEDGLAVDRGTVQDSLQQTLTQINSGLANYQKIGCVVVQQKPLDPTSDFLTPTLKLKRRTVDAQLSERYDQWAESGDKIVWI